MAIQTDGDLTALVIGAIALLWLAAIWGHRWLMRRNAGLTPEQQAEEQDDHAW